MNYPIYCDISVKNLNFSIRLDSETNGEIGWLSGYDIDDNDDWIWHDFENQLKNIIKDHLSGNWKISELNDNHGRRSAKLTKI